MVTRIWAPNPLVELEGRSGLIDLEDDALAEALIADGKVDDPRTGAFAMSFPLDSEPKGEPEGGAAGPDDTGGATYATRDAKARRRSSRTAE